MAKWVHADVGQAIQTHSHGSGILTQRQGLN